MPLSDDEDVLSQNSEDSVENYAPLPASSSKPNKNNYGNKKVYKKGIVYLSFIPPGMTVQILTQLLSKYGELGRIMLQPAKSATSAKKNKKSKRKIFAEGWVEFLKKRTAKQVAATLNNTQIGGKKKSKFHDYIWNIKYLSRFKWIHLSERITYERAVYKQRMQTEINQAKKVASHFIDKVEAAERRELIKNRKGGVDTEESGGEKEWLLSTFFKQKETDQEKLDRQKKKTKKNESREQFLKNLFA